MNKHAKTYTTNLNDEDETKIVIEYTYTPGTPETGRYGGPPENYDPGCGSEVTILSVKKADGSLIALTPQQHEEAEKNIDQHEIENPDDGPDPDDERDRRRDDEMTDRLNAAR